RELRPRSGLDDGRRTCMSGAEGDGATVPRSRATPGRILRPGRGFADGRAREDLRRDPRPEGCAGTYRPCGRPSAHLFDHLVAALPAHTRIPGTARGTPVRLRVSGRAP